MTDELDPLQHLKSLIAPYEFLDGEDLGGEWELVEDDDWVQSGKYQTSSTIVKHIASGRFFQITNSRSGSYHTDWEYNEPSVVEVRRFEKLVPQVIWEPVK